MFSIKNLENPDIRNRSKTFSIHNNYIKNFVPALRPKKNFALVSPIRLERIDETESLCDIEKLVLKKYNNSYSCPNTDDEDNHNYSNKDNDINNDESFSDFELNYEKNEDDNNENNNNIIINEKNIKNDIDNSNKNNNSNNKKENNNNISNEDLIISPNSINNIKNDRKELKNIKTNFIKRLSKEYENILSSEDNNLFIHLNNNNYNINNNENKKTENDLNVNKKRRTSFFKKYVKKEMNIKEDIDNDKKNLRKTISNTSLGNYFMLRVLSSAYEDNFMSDNNNNIMLNKNLRNTIS